MMKKIVPILLALLLAVGLMGPPAQGAVKKLVVPATTYDAYSMLYAKSAGQYWSGNQVAGQWTWGPQSAVESRISWGDPAHWPPSYNEQFVRQTDAAGDWLRLPGWFDNGVFYKVQTTSEWQAQADCRTGRTFLPTGGPQHYVRWTLSAAAYCLYAEGDVIEQSLAGVPTGNKTHFVHQQVWSPPTACPATTVPVKDLSNNVREVSNCISQWESWSSDQGTPGVMGLKLERTALLAQGLGMAYKITQTFPLVNGAAWSAELRYAWFWG